MQTFDYEQTGVKYKDCYFDVKKCYNNKLNISMYGYINNDKNVSHIFNVTVSTEQKLPYNCVVVDNYCDRKLVDFLTRLGVVKQIVSRAVVKLILLPVVELNLDMLRMYTWDYEDILCRKGA